jgi:hypothetical protein
MTENRYGQRCATCLAPVDPTMSRCGICGAPVSTATATADAMGPTSPASAQPSASSRLSVVGLPSRVPGQTVGDSPWEAFARSWEAPREDPEQPSPSPAENESQPGPIAGRARVTATEPVTPDDIAGAIVVDPSAARSRVYQMGAWPLRRATAPPTEPPEPREPPQPPVPPEPVEPPEPRRPPEPSEPPPPPGPTPVPPPVPPSPAPRPPFPNPPGPEPVPPSPPVPPAPPPSPFPTPPGPVPPPPTIGQATLAGIYQGGTYVRPDWRTTLAPTSPGRTGGNVYGGPTGLPTSANPDAPLELSGSLTGQILSRGRPQLPEVEQRAGTRRVVMILAVVLAIVVGLGAMVAFFAGDIISALVNGAAS